MLEKGGEREEKHKESSGLRLGLAGLGVGMGRVEAELV